MNRRYLILDSNYLAHRAKYVFGNLSDKGSATGVVYGFLKDLLILRDKFQTNHFVFCWDHPTYSERKEMLPTYKQHRDKNLETKEEREFELEFQRQVVALQDTYLQLIGFHNIFMQLGYEADDIIAMICKNLDPDTENGIIVTADQDLYQLICVNVTWYNPKTKEHLNVHSFKKKYGIKPKQWVKVKAIAGCHSDNVPGIPGVGEKTAIKYLRGELNISYKTYQAIKNHWQDIVLRNRRLVELPFPGTISRSLKADKVTQEGWNKVTKALGMKSIRYRNIV